MKLNFKKSIAVGMCFALLAVAFVSCKKNKNDEPSGSRKELTLDSIFLYAKQVYYWNDALPSYDAFNPRQYNSGSTDLDSYNSELFAISQLKINPLTNRPYEYYASGVAKYSNIQDLSDKNPVASIAPKGSVNTEGIGYDFGIYNFLASGTENSYKLYIRAVYPGSPAAAKGFTRGTQITSINGTAIGNNFSAQRDLIDGLLENTSTTATVSGITADGSPFTNVTLNRTSYTSSPVLKSKVFTVDSKKIGYLAYMRFSQLTNPSETAPSDSNLDPVFANFASQGITDLIIDLRYNGGGYVNTAEYLINLIAPSTASGTMYSEIYNSTMQAGNASILSKQPLTDASGKIRYSDGRMLTYADVSYTVANNTAKFSKKGSLNGVKNVVFIVSGNTASASELTINSLKPFVNVSLVGTTTYGKPVGFFPITIENKYDVYLSMFETRNSRNEGAYYSGFTPTVSSSIDDAKKDFDNIAENYINLSLNILVPGRSTSNAKSVDAVSVEASNSTLEMSNLINAPGFKGMIETRHKIK